MTIFKPGIASPAKYPQLFAEKAARTQKEFACFNIPKIACFKSPTSHFRMRAEFKVWHEYDASYYAMYKPGEYKKPVKISSFNIGSAKICQLMPALMKEINNSGVLKNKLFQIEFLTTTNDDSLITLIYHRKLDPAWESAATALEIKLDTAIIGRSRGQKIVLSRDYVIERLVVDNRLFQYQQIETGFTQPNATVCQAMLNWAQQESCNIGGDLLELYCGNGNFTLPLAINFDKVLATEVSKTSVKSALYNIRLNHINNIAIARMSSEELTQAVNGDREFHRLRDIDLKSYNFSTVFVDPPRAGLDRDTETLVSKFDNILYVSCNPSTLKSNLTTLTKTHKIRSFAFFDQFPYTHHRECGVLLQK